MPDCCVVGGGVIGLSIARELSNRGLAVTVVSRDPIQSSASWAAGGIFPAQPPGDTLPPGLSPLEQLTWASDRLHHRWAADLRDETGIDTGFRCCGTLALDVSAPTAAELRDDVLRWRRLGVRHEALPTTAIAALEPALAAAVGSGFIRGGYLLPDETQVRPPRHLAALRASCLARGVELLDGVCVREFETTAGRIAAIRLLSSGTSPDSLTADFVCIAGGAWSEGLLAPLGFSIPTTPWRGQMLLQRNAPGLLHRVINLGAGFEYLIPRDDGRLLVGSTLEDAGFDASTTAPALNRLRSLLQAILPDISFAAAEASWAGLRPGSPDGLPTIGQLPDVANGWLATGHYRAGLHLSTGTAVAIADLICGDSPQQPLDAFSPQRHQTALGIGSHC